MKSLYILCLALGSLAFAQTITFKGCYSLFDNQTFTFTKTGVDAYNKNIYITTPIDGQSCSGLGSCEFKLQWNNTLTRWEFLADEGNGTFANPLLIYYNSNGNNGAPNPPSNTVGTWVENTAVTTGQCAGSLSGTNSTMTGDVHTTALGTYESNSRSKIQIFPNPVSDIIRVSGVESAQSVQIYNMTGQLVQSEAFSSKINISQLTSGVYLLRIFTKGFQIHEFKFVKK